MFLLFFIWMKNIRFQHLFSYKSHYPQLFNFLSPSSYILFIHLFTHILSSNLTSYYNQLFAGIPEIRGTKLISLVFLFSQISPEISEILRMSKQILPLYNIIYIVPMKVLIFVMNCCFLMKRQQIHYNPKFVCVLMRLLVK